MDGLFVPIYASWFPALKHELLTFPAGKTDDQVDALGLIGQVLDKMVAGRSVEVKKEVPKVISTDPEKCTVTLNDLWEANERGSRHGRSRIH